jgi:hypothetical protein
LLVAGALLAVVSTIFEFWVDNLDETEVHALIDEALEGLVRGFGLDTPALVV